MINKQKDYYIPEFDQYVKLDDVKQEYIRIYHAYFVLQWETYELCEHFQCSNAKITKAIAWVIENKGKFPPEYLLEGAIYALRERLKLNRKLLDTELAKTKFQDKRFIIELNNQLRFDEERLFKLQSITDSKPDTDAGISASSVLRLISEAQKKTS
ncbi:TPA: hypothetical protein DIU22_02110 [Candidatus Woesebacteria bacterium]|nr:hypothetical protein [Candidatus Woesebacteria bacterium]